MTVPEFTSNIFTTSSGTKTHYLQTGDKGGTLVICLHGLGGSVKTFVTLARALPQSYDIVLVDFQGFGKTTLKSKSEPLSISGHVADLHDLIAFLQGGEDGLERRRKLVLVGHSLGTIVALHYAARHPDDVAGLALIGTGRSASHITAARQRMLDVAVTTRSKGIEITAKNSSLGNFPSAEQRPTPPEHFEEVRKAVAASDPEGYAQTCEAVVSLEHVDPDYSKIKCPTVLIAGDMDAISPVQRSGDVSKLLGGPSQVKVVESGHQPLISAFEPSAKAIEELLVAV